MQRKRLFVVGGVAAAILAVGGIAAASSGGSGTAAEAPPAPVTVTTTVTVTQPAVTQTVTRAPTSTPSTSASAPTGLAIGAAGVTATTGDGASAKIEVISSRRELQGAGDRGGESPKNGTYLVVEVGYEATAGQFEYNPFDWTVRDSEGHSYRLGDGNFSGLDDLALDSGVLAAGSKARGALIVDAPAGPLTLEYAVGHSAPAIWNVPA